MGAIAGIYVIFVLFMAPVTHFHYIFGFTYAKIYGSAIKGFFVVLPIIFTGMLIGATLNFFISRYLFRTWVKKKMVKYENKYPWIVHIYLFNAILKEGCQGF
jgi:uncharacterized membrane protein YdjX (TVP38/TMEM64 family)